MPRMTNEERLDHIEAKIDTLSEKIISITVWATIGKMSVGALLSATAVEIIHYLGVIHP